MPSIGPMELVVVLVIALVVLGPRKLPEVGRSVGKGMREFRESLTGDGGGSDEAIEEPALRAPSDDAGGRLSGAPPSGAH